MKSMMKDWHRCRCTAVISDYRCGGCVCTDVGVRVGARQAVESL